MENNSTTAALNAAVDNTRYENDNETETEDTLLSAVHWLTRYYDRAVSTSALFSGLPRGKKVTPELAVRMLEQTGIQAGWVKRRLDALHDYLFPLILAQKAGDFIIVTGRTQRGGKCVYQVVQPDTDIACMVDDATLQAAYSGYALLAGSRPAPLARAQHDILPPIDPDEHWLFSTLWRYRHYFYSAALAALLANVLTLASTFFVMNVYDRVVPNQAYATLWSMAAGVLIAILFEFTARQLRAWLIDVAGKKADLVIGARLFQQMMAVRLAYRPASAGSFANQMREFESVRDFMTSATLATLSDLPFCLLFLLIIYLIGGALAWVPLMAVPAILLISLLIQRPLSRCMQEHMQETSQKHGMLVETIEGVDALKAVRGEGVMQRRWEEVSALSARTAMKMRYLSSLTLNFTSLVQQLTTVVTLLWGVYLIHSGELSMGAMIGVVILSGRMLAPLSAMVGLAIRYQQAKTALRSLNNLMDLPIDRESGRAFLPAPNAEGHLRVSDLCFDYPLVGTQQTLSAIRQLSFDIPRGSRVAIIGNIGSGKSTLLKLLARLYWPTSGQLLLDGVDAAQIDPADWRGTVGYVGQDCRLFHGTLRENVTLGNPAASAAHFLRVARLTGLDAVAARHPMGFDMPVGERGQLLSGGQRQLVALARTLLLEPRILLLDEPTSSMDAQTEARFIQQLRKAITTQTVIVVTHRFSLLSLVDRLLVLDEGKVTHDGDKAQVIAQLNASRRAANAASHNGNYAL